MKQVTLSKLRIIIILYLIPNNSLAGQELSIFSAENLIYAVFMATAVIGFFLHKRALRWIVMLGSLAMIGFLQMGCPSPLGALQNALIHPFDFAKTVPFWVKIAIVVVPAFFLGPIFCGWVCPKGVVQELLHRKELNIKISAKADHWLRKLPYLVLLATVTASVLFHIKIFNNETSPFKVIFNLMGSPFAVGFLLVILLSSLFVFRPFCRYVCPIGALLSLVSRISIFGLKFSNSCTSCGICVKKCGMDALKAKNKIEKPIFDKSRCIACGECMQNCAKGFIKIG